MSKLSIECVRVMLSCLSFGTWQHHVSVLLLLLIWFLRFIIIMKTLVAKSRIYKGVFTYTKLILDVMVLLCYAFSHIFIKLCSPHASSKFLVIHDIYNYYRIVSFYNNSITIYKTQSPYPFVCISRLSWYLLHLMFIVYILV